MSYFSSPVPDDVKQKLDQTQEELDLVEKAISYFSSPVPDDVYVQVQQQQQQPLSYVPINFRYGVDCGDNFCPGSTSTLHYTYTPPVIPVAHFHHNSSFLPALDDYEIMFDNSSQAVGGYYIAADPKSSVMGPSQLYYQYHQQPQQQQQQLNEF
ncbi:uncharacterized protein LOC122069730 [Macadamia integrifolia]|uniref:uncharacterized protein LOC122069730 n=1 Tax=Macadamia integrifolia TaxID=60698 RepID=UPI001C4FED8F|nr:uncharacterized protein LOC122069730 [Macadamia integrifolia]